MVVDPPATGQAHDLVRRLLQKQIGGEDRPSL